ncbi:hypothetical protein K474DRAFT_931526 [Panus rudis PR-1116 ss-1]|nr:hypothetical protein K474DRAFT_931526 [Panus rudis PR-1116 ss-1]
MCKLSSANIYNPLRRDIPLVRFQNLERLVLTSPRTFCVSDHTLKSMGAMWPRLRELELAELAFTPVLDKGEPSIFLHHSRPTLSGVVEWAHRIPELSMLNIVFVPTIPENPGLHSTSSPFQATTSKLIFPSHPVNDPKQVAEFLHRNLPNLTSDGIDNSSMTPKVAHSTRRVKVDISPSWSEVRRLLSGS